MKTDHDRLISLAQSHARIMTAKELLTSALTAETDQVIDRDSRDDITAELRGWMTLIFDRMKGKK